MTVQLDKSRGGTHIGEVEFNMADFTYGEYKYRKLELVQCPENGVINFEADNLPHLEIGLKGTRQDGLVQKRMSAIKNQMDSSIKDIVKKQLEQTGDKKETTEDILKGVKSQEIFQNIVQIEVDKLKKEAKEKISQYEDKLQKKNKTINDLLTDSENLKTEVKQVNAKLTAEKQNEDKIKQELTQAQQDLERERKGSMATVGGQTKLIAEKDEMIKGLESKMTTLIAE